MFTLINLNWLWRSFSFINNLIFLVADDFYSSPSKELIDSSRDSATTFWCGRRSCGYTRLISINSIGNLSLIFNNCLISWPLSDFSCGDTRTLILFVCFWARHLTDHFFCTFIQALLYQHSTLYYIWNVVHSIKVYTTPTKDLQRSEFAL